MRPFWFSKELLRGQRKACRCWQPSCHQEEESLFKNGANTEKAKEGSIRTRGSMLYNRQCHAAQSLAPPGTGGLLPDSRAQGSIFNSICPRRSRLCLKTSASHFSACFPQQCLQLMLSPSPPPQGPRPDHFHTHTLSAYLQQHVCVLTGAASALPVGGNFRHPGGLMGEMLLSELSQHATNTPARFTHLEVALTFIRGIFCQLDRSCVPLQPVAGFGKLDASSCRML